MLALSIPVLTFSVLAFLGPVCFSTAIFQYRHFVYQHFPGQLLVNITVDIHCCNYKYSKFLFHNAEMLYESEIEPVRIFSTRPVSFKIYAGWPPGRRASLPVSDHPSRPVFYRRFLFTVQCIQWKIFKSGLGMGEVLKFVTLDGGLRKKCKQIFSYWWQIICNLPSSKH